MMQTQRWLLLLVSMLSANAIAEPSIGLTKDDKSLLSTEVFKAIAAEVPMDSDWKIPNVTWINESFGCPGAKRVIKADFDGDQIEDYAFWAAVKLELVKDTRLYLYESSTRKLIVLEHFTGDDMYVPDLGINTEKLPDTDDYPRYREVIPLITDLPRLVVADYCGTQSTEWVKSKKGDYVSIDRGC